MAGKKWIERGVWGPGGGSQVLNLRARAALAAAFSEGPWADHPWRRERDWEPIAVAINRTISIFLQAENLINTKHPRPMPPIEFCVSYPGDPIRVSRKFDNKIMNKTAFEQATPQFEEEFQTANSKTVKIALKTLSGFLGDELKTILASELRYQMAMPVIANVNSRRAQYLREARNPKKYELRIRFTDFVRRFLLHFREGKSPGMAPAPFLAFFLAPRTESEWPGHIPSGLLGYVYEIDEEQDTYLREEFGDGPAIDTISRGHVPFPGGQCGQVFLTAQATAPLLVEGLTGQSSKGLAELEKAILGAKSLLIEIPIFRTGIMPDLEAPDGPENILCICLPTVDGSSVNRVSPKVIRSVNGNFSDPIAAGSDPSGDQWTAETIGNAWKVPTGTPYHAGEIQIVREVGEQLIHRYVTRRPEVGSGELVGSSAKMQSLRSLIETLARQDQPVLITGETGTGKELVARGLHDKSSRAQKPFRPIVLNSIPPTIVASELFGILEGQATGVHAKTGIFEATEGGTVFLDEIGELALDIQPMLLRTIQERRVLRIGAHDETPVNVRVISATNRSLTQEVQDGRFRSDLLRRINVFHIHVPPLRERRDDIPELVRHFIARIAMRDHKNTLEVEKEAMDMLVQYSWPQNVGELMNVIERCFAFSEAMPGLTVDVVRRAMENSEG